MNNVEAVLLQVSYPAGESALGVWNAGEQVGQGAVICHHCEWSATHETVKLLDRPDHSKSLLLSDCVVSLGRVEQARNVRNGVVVASVISLDQDRSNGLTRGITVNAEWCFVRKCKHWSCCECLLEVVEGSLLFFSPHKGCVFFSIRSREGGRETRKI